MSPCLRVANVLVHLRKTPRQGIEKSSQSIGRSFGLCLLLFIISWATKFFLNRNRNFVVRFYLL